MAWNEPTRSEAWDAYLLHRSRYSEAASEQALSRRQESGYRAQRDAAAAQHSALSEKKINFEKRVEGIEAIIREMEGGVPEAIAGVMRALGLARGGYEGSMRLLGGASAADLEKAFGVPSVEGEMHSASALQQFKAEKARLEQEIEELKTRIASLSATIEEMTGRINSSISAQAALQKTMNASAYDMNHYRKYMY